MVVPARPNHILLNVGETLQVGARSGIPRVVLKLARDLSSRIRIDLVRWDALEGRLRFLDRHELDHLFGRAAWPPGLAAPPHARRLRVRFGDEVETREGVWLLQPEVPYHSPDGLQAFATCLTQAREYGWNTAAVIYDVIPVLNPAYANERANYLRYLAEITRADLLLPISRHSGDQLRAYAGETGITLPPMTPVPLGESDQAKARRPMGRADLILAVGTVEPRKRQVELVRAYAMGRARSAVLARLSLQIAGSLHPAVARDFSALVARTPGVRYRAYLSEPELESLWDGAAFSVFASDDEGFGLPVAESLARGTPCIAVDQPPMTEIAGGAGVHRVAAAEPSLLCDALIALAEDADLRQRLGQQIAGRTLRTWGDYAHDILAAMARAPVRVNEPASPLVFPTENEAIQTRGPADIVRFSDGPACGSFSETCVLDNVPAILPIRQQVAGEPDQAPAFSAFRRLTRIAQVERNYAQARRALVGEAAARPIFLRIIVSTYNRRAVVLQNVRWLLDKVVRKRHDVELVVVDNASTDGSGTALRASFEGRSVRIVENPANVGMLGNMRVCSQLPGAEYVWLIGDDDFVVPAQLDDLLAGLRANVGTPLAYLNFTVYHRETLGPADTVEVLQAEARPLAVKPIASGVYPLHIAAAQHDNLFTAIYVNVWRSDVLAAAYDHPFHGTPFSNLAESIACTKTLLESYGECEVYWKAQAAIVGNAHIAGLARGLGGPRG